MRKFLVAVLALAFGLTACQKEASFENPNGSPGSGAPNDAVLTRVVYAAGADSVATDFSYDASKRLVAASTTSTNGGNQFIRLYRNSSGILTRYTIQSDDLASVGLDSLVTDVKYDASRSRYTYSLTTINLSNISLIDSTAFLYDNATNNLVTKEGHGRTGPSPYVAYGKTEYAYSGANIASEKSSSYDAATGWTPDYTFSYSYDNKPNPMKFGVEGLIALTDFLTASAPYGSANNATKTDFVDHTDATNNFSFTSSYTYNSNNKPASGTATVASGGGYDLRYYYN